VMQPSNT